MSTGVQPEQNRVKNQGNSQVPGGVRREDQQEFDSWRHQTHQHQQQGFNPMSSMASDPYLSSFYAGSYHYQGFGVGDGTWSNGGGDHMTFLGSFAPGTEPAGYSADLGPATMFSAGGGFGAFTQPAAGYGFDFHTGSGYSQWGNAAGRSGDAYYRPEFANHPEQDGRGRGVTAAEQAMQGLSIAGPQPQDGVGVGGGGPGKDGVKNIHDKDPVKIAMDVSSVSAGPTASAPVQPKKMSWASIASQPAKPAPPPIKNKKPGVLLPPVVGTGKHNMDIGTWDGNAKQNGSCPAAGLAGGVPPPPPAGKPGGPGAGRGWAGVAGSHGPRGARPGGAPPTFGHGAPVVPAPSHPVLDELRGHNEYNPREFDLNPKNARFFVVKSYSEDDIHRSIKYEIWCSTEHGNKRLDSAYREREGKGPIYLFFSVNGSGHFCGIAQMLQGVDYNSSAGVWAQDKWKGQFKVKWIYVKDVPNSQLRHIRLENNENKPVTNSRDTQEVPADKGKQVLKIIHGYKHTTSIFDDFIHYEKRQEEDEGRRPTPELQEHEQRERVPREERNGSSAERGGHGGERGGHGGERGGHGGERGGHGGERGGHGDRGGPGAGAGRGRGDAKGRGGYGGPGGPPPKN